MTDSSNVKFVEADGKWCWKRYDENGSVSYRSPLFDTEREAREDYASSGDAETAAPAPEAPAAPAEQETAPASTGEQTAPAAPEGTAEVGAESTAGTAAPDADQQASADVGSASL
jgi:hypothetical protein